MSASSGTLVTGTLVGIVDDDPSVRKGLARLVKGAGYRVEVFASAREFLARPQQEDPSCLLLDVRMPGLTGPELQEALAIAGRRMSIVFVSGHGDVVGSVKAMKGGAIDFLTKPVDARELLDAIERAVAKAVTAQREQAGATDVQGRLKTLTAREAQVFALVVTGMLNKQVAAELGIVEKTVKVHRARVMQKMRAGSLAELVRLADRAGIIAKH
jgi:FixJ family two-component response regulator